MTMRVNTSVSLAAKLQSRKMRSIVSILGILSLVTAISCYRSYVAARRVDVNAQDCSMREVVRRISRAVGVRIEVDPSIQKNVSIRIENADWPEALEAIARQTFCRVVNVDAKHVRIVPTKPISLECEDAGIRVVLESLAREAGANIFIADDVTARISLSLRDVPWGDALETIVRANRYWCIPDAEDPKIIQVVSESFFKGQLETRLFTLEHVRHDELVQSPVSCRHRSGKEHERETMEVWLERALSEEGRIEYDEATRTFLVTDIRPRLEDIAASIRFFDVESRRP